MLPFIKLFLLICISLPVSGQFRQVQKPIKPFDPGEQLFYSVKVGPIHGGDASLTLRQDTIDDRDYYHAIAEAKTIGLTNKIFNVRDIFESYFDKQSALPYKSIRDITEGNYKRYQEAYFDHEAGTAYSVRLDSTIKTPKDILDMVSLLYYLRSLDLQSLKSGDVLRTMTLFDDELFPFDIRYKGTEEVKTKFGKIRCLRFDPVVEPGRIFKSEDDMTIWLSDDRNLIPIKVRFDLVLVSLRMELSQYSSLKYPLMFIQ